MEGKGLNNCMSPSHGPCANFQFGLCISANSIININTSNSLQKSKKQFASRQKMSIDRQGPGSSLGYTSMFNIFILKRIDK